MLIRAEHLVRPASFLWASLCLGLRWFREPNLSITFSDQRHLKFLTWLPIVVRYDMLLRYDMLSSKLTVVWTHPELPEDLRHSYLRVAQQLVSRRVSHVS